MKTVFVLGDSGLVGKAIINQIKNEYNVYGASRKDLNSNGWTHLSFDLEKDNIVDLLYELKPELIISCTRGEYGAQLKCHEKIIQYAKKYKSKLYYFSTANVFDGDPTTVKYESDRTFSISDYGSFKIKCENMIIKELVDKGIIIRLPMVYGADSLRVNEIKKTIHQNKSLEVYNNLYFTAVWDIDVAKQLKYIIENNLKGIFHLAPKDVVNHLDFYRRFLPLELIISENSIQDYEKYYLAIKTERKELNHLEFSNDDVIMRIKETIERSIKIIR